MPYWMKRPFVKLIRRKLINNSQFLGTYESLLRLDKMSEGEIEEEQKKKLNNVLRHAYSHSKYYHCLFAESGFTPDDDLHEISDLQKLPILTKEQLKANLDDIVADDISNYYPVTTGGTSGEPTKVMMSKDAIYKEWAFIYHYWSKFGYDYKRSRLATFRGIEMKDKMSEINPLYAEIRMNPFILNLDNVEQYVKAIQQYKAEFIYGYPSAIYNFCRLAEKRGIELSGVFKAVLFISENLYDFQETLIRKFLQCPIVMFYGHSERAVFAEKYEHGYKFNPFYGITEVGNNGELIVTGFINSKTPLIRYIVDDYAEEKQKGYFDIFGHRNSDIIFGKNGEQIRASLLNFHGELFDKYGQIQILQEKAGELVIRIPRSSEKYDGEAKTIIDKMNSLLNGQFKVSIKYVDNLELTARGKYKFLIQRINATSENENG